MNSDISLTFAIKIPTSTMRIITQLYLQNFLSVTEPF